MSVSKEKILKTYLLILGTFTLFWWPLSHWFYPGWYHSLMGFESYDYSLVKIIGTIGIFPVVSIFFAAKDPKKNRDTLLSLLIFFPLLALTYVFLINTRDFPKEEYFNVFLLVANSGIIYFFLKKL